MQSTDVLISVLTLFIAVSTVVYTVTTIGLWKAARRATDIAKYTLIMNFYLRFHEFTEKAHDRKDPEATVLEVVDKLFLKKGIEEFLRGMTPEMESVVAPVVLEFDAMLKARGHDMEAMEQFKPIARRFRK